MKNTFMFDLKIYEKKNNISISVYENITMISEYLDGDGEIVFTIKNDIPFQFNRLKFERIRRRMDYDFNSEINRL